MPERKGARSWTNELNTETTKAIADETVSSPCSTALEIIVRHKYDGTNTWETAKPRKN